MVAIKEEKKQFDRKSLSGPGLRSFFRIAALWKLTNEEQMILLGVTNPSTFYNWRDKAETSPPTLSKDTLERISYILGIYKSLQILLPENAAADRWIKTPNAAVIFGGHSALQRMCSGNVADLYVVRQYLDAERGGWA